MTIIRICYHTSIGLENDAIILKAALKKVNPDATIYLLEYSEQELYTRPPNDDTSHSYEIQFFLEHIHHSYYKQGKLNIYVPNVEFINSMDMNFISQMDCIWSKTESGFKLLKSRFGDKVFFSEWTSIDRNEDFVKSYNSFLHVRGCSRFKNSGLVLDVWSRHSEWPHLTMIQHSIPDTNGNINIPTDINIATNITLIQRILSDDELNKYMNTHNIHICPSSQEGFGHYINEARSCEAVVCATHGYPMMELVSNNECLIETDGVSKQSLGLSYVVLSDKLEKCLQHMIDVYINSEGNSLGHIGRQQRINYMQQKNRFHENVRRYMNSLNIHT